MSIKLTAYSHGAGCGCKLSPAVLSEILSGEKQQAFQSLLVGNSDRDDAAVYDLDGKTAIISTTDFFMPIVDDPADFGGIAAVNAISDIYAMGGTPMMAIAILGWPVDKISTDVAREVLDGAKAVCTEAGIPLAGGHSIDAPEPIFGLAVTGSAPIEVIKRNGDGQEGDLLYLTKPIGVGLITTAQKKGIARPADLDLAIKSMLTLNKIGAVLAQRSEVHAMTDVTGFGLAGHLIEMAESSGLSAVIDHSKIPVLPCTNHYLALGTSPGGTARNWQSYRDSVTCSSDFDFRIVADPQTSGGLLVSIAADAKDAFEAFMTKQGFMLQTFGSLSARQTTALTVN
ncbi:MAG: selenide,water dikinase [Cyclobacteriaceae bacterium]|jgi:selenide,water dikinase